MTVLEVIFKTVAMQNHSMALLHVSHPPAQICGGEAILYIYFSNISWTLSSEPHYKSLFGAPFGCTLLQKYN